MSTSQVANGGRGDSSCAYGDCGIVQRVFVSCLLAVVRRSRAVCARWRPPFVPGLPFISQRRFTDYRQVTKAVPRLTANQDAAQVG
jgi:hypothetical protein